MDDLGLHTSKGYEDSIIQKVIVSGEGRLASLSIKLELTRSEVERFEHTIIESGKARLGAHVQYLPHVIRDAE